MSSDSESMFAKGSKKDSDGDEPVSGGGTPMRCDEITRELAAPAGRVEPSALAAHLAACPACAEFSRGRDRLDRLWDATRPPLPTPGSFDAVWTEVARAADAAPALPSRRPHAFRPRTIAAAVLAQAAALLVAALVLQDHPAPQQPEIPIAQVPKMVEIAEGQIAIISVDGRDADTFVDASTEGTIAPDLDLLNEFEAMASL